MAEATASRKRQRTDDDEPGVKAEPSSDEGLLAHEATLLPLHYDDGNVVIRARAHFSAAELEALARDGNCKVNQSMASAFKSIPQEGLNGLVKYKIHRGVLGSHSTVFADHFRGEDTILSDCEEEHRSGLLSVFMLSDERSSLDAFLKAMYIPDHLQKRVAQRGWIHGLRLLSDVLSLSDKYNSPSIRSIVVNLLERQYPSNLSHWTVERFKQSALVEAGAVFKLGMQHKIGSIMPPLLYRLGTSLRGFNGLNSVQDQAFYDRIVAPLTAQDLRILLGGSLTLYAHSDCRLAKLATLDESPTCMQPQPRRFMRLCMTALSQYVRPPYAAHDAPRFVYYSTNPLGRFDEVVAAISTSSIICPECKNFFTQQAKAAKLQLWKDLPRIFNVADLVGEEWGSE